MKNLLGLATILAFGTLASGAASADGIRRVITSQNADGGSYIASDEMVEGVAIEGVGNLFTMWGDNGVNTVGGDDAMPTFETLYPPIAGHRVYIVTFPAGAEIKPEADSLTGADAKMDPSEIPGLHKSDTTDFDIVLSGEVQSILSDGTIITLKAGDTIVINGSDHAWRNATSEPAVVAFFMTGATR